MTVFMIFDFLKDITNNIKLLLYKENPSLLEKIDFEDKKYVFHVFIFLQKYLIFIKKML